MSGMVEVKTAELIPPALDWAVAHATIIRYQQEITVDDCAGVMRVFFYGRLYVPMTEWGIYATLCERFPEHKHDDQMATLRAIVAAKLGDVVSVPAELLNSEQTDGE